MLLPSFRVLCICCSAKWYSSWFYCRFLSSSHLNLYGVRAFCVILAFASMPICCYQMNFASHSLASKFKPTNNGYIESEGTNTHVVCIQCGVQIEGLAVRGREGKKNTTHRTHFCTYINKCCVSRAREREREYPCSVTTSTCRYQYTDKEKSKKEREENHHSVPMLFLLCVDLAFTHISKL